jgi:phenylacetate-CoA ligase
MDEGTATSSAPAMEAEITRRFVATLRKTQFMPPDALVTYQRGLMERLVRHARAHVPFYRDDHRLDRLFRPDDTIDWHRWSELEPITRTDVQNDHERLRSEFLGPEHGRVWILSTSGSTGEPVRIAHSELSARVAWTATLLRDFERHGIDPTRRLVQLNPFTPGEFGISGTREHPTWLPDLVHLDLGGERFDLSDTRPADELIEAIVALRPAYLHVQPTALELLVAHDSRRMLSRLGIAAVICYGEHLSEPTKLAAERHFDCRLIDLYGSNECGFIASSCPQCGNYHVHAEAKFVEIVDEDGQRCPADDVGRIIVTPLYNYAMPLIRYEHADEARVAPDGACAITLPVLGEILGKKREPFVFAGNHAIRPTIPAEAVVAHLGARMFQVAQVATDRCEFRIVPGTLDPAAMQFGAMTALLRRMWWTGLKIDYRVVDQIPRRSARAKVQQFISEIS